MLDTHDPIVAGVRNGAAILYDERNADRGTPFRASGIGGCQRQLALRADPKVKRLGISEKSALTLDHGTLRGKELAHALQRACGKGGELQGWEVLGLEVECLAPVPHPHGEWSLLELRALQARLPDQVIDFVERKVFVRGRADLVLRNPNGRISVGDFKTAHPFSFKSKRTEPMDSTYLAQLGLYHFFNPWHSKERSDAPWLLYESKEDHEMYRLEADPTQAWVCLCNSLIKVGQTMLGLVTGGELPTRPHAPNAKGLLPWQCRYCDVHQTCWNKLITKVEGDPLQPKNITVTLPPDHDGSLQ